MLGFISNNDRDYLWSQECNFLLVAENELTKFFMHNKIHTNLFSESCTFYHKVYKGESLVFEAVSLRIHNTLKEFQIRFQSLVNNVTITETKRFHLKGWFNLGKYIDIPIEATFLINGETYTLKVFDTY